MDIADDVDLRSADVIHVESIGSTNEEGLRLGRSGLNRPLWVRADRQTGGRGRLGRSWESPVGNLYASLVLPDPAAQVALPQLAHVAAVALAEAIWISVPRLPSLSIKWPNDLLIGAAKVAGILVEAVQVPNQGTVAVVGCGVNCTSHPRGLAYAATDLATASASPVTIDAVFDALRAEMERALIRWDRGRGYSIIRDDWLRHALPIGTTLGVMLGDRRRQGIFRGIDATGRLLCECPDGLHTIEAGDVVLMDGSADAQG